jgi:carbonic anhydrase
MLGTGTWKIAGKVTLVALAGLAHGCAEETAVVALVDAAASGGMDAASGAGMDAAKAPDAAGGDAAAAAPHWSYEGEEGPAHWGDIPEYATCKTGVQQSPVDVPRWVQFAPLADLTFAYAASPATIKDNGHTVQVDFTGGTNTLTIGGKAFALAQFHFHAHSEHTLGGRELPLEMHLVHKAADGELAVLGVLFKSGAENGALAPVFAGAATATMDPAALTAPLDPAQLLPANKNGWAYSGSLTTPPCSEGVRWHVFSTVVELSPAQLDSFTAKHAVSSRPVQGLGARTIAGGNGTFTAAHWEYEEAAEDGPAKWGALGSGEFATCAAGGEQSPIDLPGATVAAKPLAGIATAYAAAPATIVDNGHTVQVAFTGGTNKITLGGKEFSLLQFHFHQESEHTVNAHRYPLEMHLVHKAADGELAVLGVLFESGAANAALAPVFDAMATATATAAALPGTVGPDALLPIDRSGWAYGGSLTTPPCTEGVRWHVYASPLAVSPEQLAKFKHHPSFRPVQALGARVVAGGN